jgi:hypothetical protein
MGYRTLVEKQCPVVFKVQNIAPERKRVKVFHTPIKWGCVRDLLAIPNVSEDVIRHSLLKGDLNIKLRCEEIIVVESNIELLQFDECHRQFLIDHGIMTGVDPGDLGGGGGDFPYALKQQVALLGAKDSSNRVFTVPAPDKFLNGVYDNNDFRILIRHNGRDLVETEDYFVAESGGPGTGFDTVILCFAPRDVSILVADYYIEV